MRNAAYHGPFVTFQSTHPVGGGTRSGVINDVTNAISIHPPRGGWDRVLSWSYASLSHFNPPTPWGVGLLRESNGQELLAFQSTHPVGGGTVYPQHQLPLDLISIHPPRGGWDQSLRRNIAVRHISIHPPRGGWDRILFYKLISHLIFQSTHPVGGGTNSARSHR